MAANFSSVNEEQDNRRKRNNVLLILLLLLLLASVGFNIYQYMYHEKKVEGLSEEIFNSEDLRKNLQVKLDSVRAQLGEFRGRNEKLDQLVSDREKDLQEKASRIEALLKQNKISYNKYVQAQGQIDEWKYFANKYLEESRKLAEENKNLKAQNQGLQENIRTQNQKIDKLTDEKVLMSNKLKLGARLTMDPKDIEITGVQLRSGGKERETDRARKIEKLKICFNVPKNLSATSGPREIFVQVLDPSGQTIAIESLGSGVTEVEGEQAQFSTRTEIQYDNETVSNHCVYWGNPNDVKFQEGRYTVRLYTEGYKMGEKNINIK